MPEKSDPINSREIPLKLEEWRLHRNLTQRALAERSGVAASTINEIETYKRKPRPSTLRRLAMALDVDDWNLYNMPRDSYGQIPELARLLERLERATTELGICGQTGRSAAYGYMSMGFTNEDAEDLWANLGDNLIPFLFGFWRQLGKIVWDESSQEDRKTMQFAVERWVQEMKEVGITVSDPPFEGRSPN